ncbi:MAG: DNA-binding protein MutS2 [Methanosaeta sp. PtaB.Bin039]|nr:MAG: DNA-binding protein MutS2 [Methanosaeta sp. PtaB.Bin039]HOT06464.1 DNA mismatch repair protein MutS [Methanotrichaceae archaeon]
MKENSQSSDFLPAKGRLATLLSNSINISTYEMGWTMAMELRDIPGIGPRLKERLVQHFGSEEAALQVVLGGDVAALSGAVSERQAVSLARFASAVRHRVRPEDFLATEEAGRVCDQILRIIAGFAHTDYARLRLSALFPSSSMELIQENRRLAGEAVSLAQRLQGTGIEDLLRKIGPLRERPSPRVRDRALVVDSAKVLEGFRARGLDRLIDLHLVENPMELRDVVGGYRQVGFLGDLEFESRNLENVESTEVWYLVPEAILAYFQENLGIIRAALSAAEILEQAGIEEFPGLQGTSALMADLEMGEDQEACRLHDLSQQLAPAVEEAFSWANGEIRRQIEASSVTLGGKELLLALGRGVSEVLGVQMRGIYQRVLRDAAARALDRLDLRGGEAVKLEEVFAVEAGFPLQMDRGALRRFEQEVLSAREARILRARRRLASELFGRKEAVKSLIRYLMEFDFRYSLGCFCLSSGLVEAELTSHPCIGFLEGRNLFLRDAEPVSYALGDTSLTEFSERVSILSGVNSGGKTSLLDLMAQVAILAHMGLPVPARQSRVGLFCRLFYFSKGRGTLSAGAFETALRKFSAVEDDQSKLVLADELEAITEPGASARIIAAMLDELNYHGSAGVFVSHLAGEVRRFIKTPVRVDGIEAEGLDSQNNLVVRRSPRYNHLARSTPELILARLVRTTRGRERDFYRRLLDKF